MTNSRVGRKTSNKQKKKRVKVEFTPFFKFIISIFCLKHAIITRNMTLALIDFILIFGVFSVECFFNFCKLNYEFCELNLQKIFIPTKRNSLKTFKKDELKCDALYPDE